MAYTDNKKVYAVFNNISSIFVGTVKTIRKKAR